MIHPRRAQQGSPLPLAVVSDDAPRHGALPGDDEAPINPRHAAATDERTSEPEQATGTDGDFVSPRRPVLRLLAAPVAVLAVAGVTFGALALTPGSSEAGADVPQVVESAPALVDGLGTSRDLLRPALASSTPSASVSTPSASPTPTPAASSSRPSSPSPRASVRATSTSTSATPTKAASTKAATRTASPRPSRTAVDLGLGEKAGTRYTSTALRVRTKPSTDAAELTVLAEGSKVTITERTVDGWRQVSLDGRPGWVRQSYLQSQRPAAEPSAAATSEASSKPTAVTTTATTKTTSSSRTASSSSAPCPAGSSVERGLTSRTIAVYRSVCANFPSIGSYGGYRGSGDAHGQGRAIDVMVSGDAGWAVARWARANAGRLGITEVIYSQQIWTTQRSGEGWRSMSDRGGVTANHYDHVHITVG